MVLRYRLNLRGAVDGNDPGWRRRFIIRRIPDFDKRFGSGGG